MKIGIVGNGMIVHSLLEFIHEIKEIELTAITSLPDEYEKVKETAKKYNIKRTYKTYDDLLEDNEVNIVYLGVPNNLHHIMAKKALLNNKHVILEKPFTSTFDEAVELKELAINKSLFLWEAITNQYFPNYYKIKELLPELGNIKIVECNFSQYSSRYNAFKEGVVMPAFDPNCSGGALMDLNIYNVHFLVGLFGIPSDVHYYCNIEKNIDTSGLLVLEYENFKCVCIGSKDCKAPFSNNIQGDKGCIHISSASSFIDSFEINMNNNNTVTYNLRDNKHRMYYEFAAFLEMFKNNDLKKCYSMLQHSINVMEIVNKARTKAGIRFINDR